MGGDEFEHNRLNFIIGSFHELLCSVKTLQRNAKNK